MVIKDTTTFSSLKKRDPRDLANQVPLVSFRRSGDEDDRKPPPVGKLVLCFDANSLIVKESEPNLRATDTVLSRIPTKEVSQVLITAMPQNRLLVSVTSLRSHGTAWDIQATLDKSKQIKNMCEKHTVRWAYGGKPLMNGLGNHSTYSGLGAPKPKRAKVASLVDDMESSLSSPVRPRQPQTPFQKKHEVTTNWRPVGPDMGVGSDGGTLAAPGADALGTVSTSGSPTQPKRLSKLPTKPPAKLPPPVFSTAPKTPKRPASANGTANGAANSTHTSPKRAFASPQTSPDQLPNLDPTRTLDSIPSTPPSPSTTTESGTVDLRSPAPRKSARVASLGVPAGAYTEESLLEPTPQFVAKLRKDGYYDLRHEFGDGKFYNLTVQDMARLEENVYLDDSLVMFLLKWFYDTSLPAHFKPKTHVFSTFFFPSVEHNPKETVAKWTAKLDVGKPLLVIPIHQKFHWSVLVVANLDKWISTGTEHPSLVLFDSMRSTDAVRNQLFRNITHILTAVLESKNLKPFTRTQVKRLTAKVPKQNNSSDCGVFLVNFMSHLFNQPERFLEKVAVATPKSPFAYSSFDPQQEFGRPELLMLLREVCACSVPQEKIAESEESDLEMFET